MGGIDTNIAATTLAIALIAFFIALGQLLQQYFATADGHRRCQRSVMGGWAKMTRLRWRWREFRFETLYTTPEIILRSPSMFGVFGVFRALGKFIVLDGSQKSREASLLETPLPRTNRYESVCWLLLLNALHDSAKNISSLLGFHGYLESGLNPAVRFQESSWDFQVPDVVRPLAKTTVATIAIIARHLGMRWKEFDPVHGIMRAESNGQIITATSIRSLGTVIQYTDTGSRAKNIFSEQYIPVEAANSLGFGQISYPPKCCYETQDYLLPIGTRQEVLATIRSLEPSGHCADKLQSPTVATAL